MVSQKSLLGEVSDFSNLYNAFRACSRGKKQSKDYQSSFFAIGEKLKTIQKDLEKGCFRWKGYREFFVHDPKRRLIMCAPFVDRIVHHAICQVIEPVLDPLMPKCVYACRSGKGNQAAVLELFSTLQAFGKSRFVMKLDVEKYFASINHNILLEKICLQLQDTSLEPLLKSLLNSQPDFRRSGSGIPIGNLTSQLFANFYLTSADEIGVSLLGDGYFRYMDDMILLGNNKSAVHIATKAICEHIETTLLLKIPYQKRIPLGCDPVPFLGYVVDHTKLRILKRTSDRFRKKVKKQISLGAPNSQIAQMELSFDSWSKLG